MLGQLTAVWWGIQPGLILLGKSAKNMKICLKITELALFNGIDKMRPGNVLDDISGAVEDTALGAASNIPKELQGKKNMVLCVSTAGMELGGICMKTRFCLITG